jgi:hypothetical protein
MCIGKAPSVPAPPPPPEPPKDPPKKADPEVRAARTKERTRAALAQGRDSDILVGPLGLDTPALTSKKKLLGQ